jgi:hypothetical protein
VGGENEMADLLTSTITATELADLGMSQAGYLGFAGCRREARAHIALYLRARAAGGSYEIPADEQTEQEREFAALVFAPTIYMDVERQVARMWIRFARQHANGTYEANRRAQFGW